MGNSIVTHKSEASGKVILQDGGIRTIEEPLTVAELMLEHQQQVVVELDSLQELTMKRPRPSPLPADTKLDLKKIYLMLPLKNGRVASLTSPEFKRAYSTASKVLGSRDKPRFLPLLVKSCRAQDKDCVVILGQQKQNHDCCKDEILTMKVNVGQGLIESDTSLCFSKQVSCRNWKPNLETIQENIIR